MSARSYNPRFFPVQIEPGKQYPVAHSRRGECRVREEPWWYEGSFDEQRSGGATHHAIDIFAPLGARIVATRPGRVLQTWRYQGETRPGSGWSEKGGWFVRMEVDDDGSVEYFSHLKDEPKVRSGQRVRAGQLLGYMGQTGNATYTCPHLHYQVRDRNGRAVNPGTALRRLHDAQSWIYRGSDFNVGPWIGAGVATVAGVGLIYLISREF